MCRCVWTGCFKMVRPDLFFPICFQSKNCQLSLVSWKAATKNSTNEKLLKSVRAAAEVSTSSRHVAAQPTEAFSFHYSSVAGGMMQKWSKHEASFVTRWPSGRGLPTPQQTSGAEANMQRSCQLWEWERGVGGASRPGKSGRLLGYLA